MKKRKRLLSGMLCMILFIVSFFPMELHVSANELEQQEVIEDSVSENTLEPDHSKLDDEEEMQEVDNEIDDTQKDQEDVDNSTDCDIRTEEEDETSESVSENNVNENDIQEEPEVKTIAPAMTIADGNIASGNFEDISWAIDANGKLVVEGRGNYVGDSYSSSDVPWYKYRESIISAEINVKDMTVAWCMFYDCSNLISLDLSGFDTSKIRDMGSMFRGCSSLTSLNLNGFDTSNVRYMHDMFEGCSSLASLDLSGVDTGNVAGMGWMFRGCSSLTDLNLEGLDTSNVTDMRSMFEGCSSLRSLDLSGFNTSKVTDMSRMFSECKSLEKIDLSALNVCAVINTDNMLSVCDNLALVNTPYNLKSNITLPESTGYIWCKVDGTAITELPLNLNSSIEIKKVEKPILGDGDKISGSYQNITWYIDSNGKLVVEGTGDFSDSTSSKRAPWYSYRTDIKSVEVNVEDMVDASYMFYDCNNLMTLDLSNFDTRNIKNMSHMFAGCSGLTVLDLGSFDTGQVVNMSDMFYRCFCLEILDLSSFDTGKVVNMGGMFSQCSNLKSLDLSSFNVNNVTNFRSIFKFCYDLAKINTPLNLKQSVDLYTSYADCWYGPDGLKITELPQNLNFSITIMKNKLPISAEDDIASGYYGDINWSIDANGKLVVKGTGEFKEKGAFNYNYVPWYSCREEIKSAEINITDITDTSFMFWGCRNLTYVNLSDLDIAQVTRMRSMFQGCTSLETLDLSRFDTSNVTEMSSMFRNCSSLASLDLSNFDTSNVTDMNDMFGNCSGLTSLDLSRFDTSNVIDMSYMFYGCSNLLDLNLSSFNTSSVTNMRCMFTECNSLKNLDLSRLDTSKVRTGEGKDADYRVETMLEGCDALSIIKTPYNLNRYIFLPGKPDDIWYDPNGEVLSELPMNLSYSITITKNVNNHKLQPPVFLPAEGTIDKDSQVALHADQDAVIYYTTDESDPIANNVDTTKKYTSPIVISEDTTIKAIAVDPSEMHEVSDIAMAKYIVCTNNLMFVETSMQLKVGEEKDIIIKELPTTKTEADIQWNSSDESIAKVDSNGKVTAVSEGSVVVTASVADHKGEIVEAECQITVESAIYQVTFIGWKNKVVKVEAIKAGESAALPDIKAPIGYEIVGWKGDYTNILGDITIEAQYKPIEYTITYYLNGGTNVKDNPESYTIEKDSIELKAAFGKTGYQFTGWYLDENCSGNRISSIEKGSYGNKVLYAGWKDERGLWLKAEGTLEGDYNHIPDQQYTGKAIRPVVEVWYGDQPLKINVDYNIKYKNNKTVNLLSSTMEKNKAPTVIIKGKGNYTGTLTKTFVIAPKSIADEDVQIDDLAKACNNKLMNPVPMVKWNGKRLINNKDFVLSYPDGQNTYREPGEYKIRVEGIGNYTGTKDIGFVITDPEKEILLNKVKIAGIPAQEYTGKRIILTEDILKLTYGKEILRLGEDYALEYGECIDPGNYGVVVTGRGKYRGMRRITFKIEGIPIKTVKIGRLPNLAYNGGKQKLEPEQISITDKNGNPLQYNSDYILSFSNNQNAGIAKMIIIGKGQYTGKVTKSFKITPYSFNDGIQIEFTDGSNVLEYEKGGVKPEVKVSFNGMVLKKGEDYTLSYANNTLLNSVKAPVVTVKGKKNYTGSKSLTFNIVRQDIANINITVPDMNESMRAGRYMSKPVLTDRNGKKLKAGVDFEKTYVYTDENGISLSKHDRPKAGDMISVTVKGMGNYKGEISANFYIIAKEKNLSKATAIVNKKLYYTINEQI